MNSSNPASFDDIHAQYTQNIMKLSNPASFDNLLNNSNPLNIPSNATISYVNIQNTQNNNNGLNGASTILNYTDYATNIVYKNPSSVVTNVVTDAYGNFNNSYRERSGTENLVRSGLATVGTNCAIFGGPPGAVIGTVVGVSLLTSEVVEAHRHSQVEMNNNITKMYIEKFGEEEGQKMAEDAIWERTFG
jgi:hypothetical protein